MGLASILKMPHPENAHDALSAWCAGAWMTAAPYAFSRPHRSLSVALGALHYDRIVRPSRFARLFASRCLWRPCSPGLRCPLYVFRQVLRSDVTVMDFREMFAMSDWTVWTFYPHVWTRKATLVMSRAVQAPGHTHEGTPESPGACCLMHTAAARCSGDWLPPTQCTLRPGPEYSFCCAAYKNFFARCVRAIAASLGSRQNSPEPTMPTSPDSRETAAMIPFTTPPCVFWARQSRMSSIAGPSSWAGFASTSLR